MKRTPFKIKPRKPLKRSNLKRKPLDMSQSVKVKPKTRQKPKIGLLKKKLWKVFSQFIKQRDKYTCFTCGRKGEGSGMHAGHFIPKSVGGMALYFHEENVRAQCFNCNINLGGNQWEYGIRLGPKVKELEVLKKQITKVDEVWYLEKIAYYSQLIKPK